MFGLNFRLENGKFLNRKVGEKILANSGRDNERWEDVMDRNRVYLVAPPKEPVCR